MQACVDLLHVKICVDAALLQANLYQVHMPGPAPSQHDVQPLCLLMQQQQQQHAL